MAALERITVKLPAKFDPNIHSKALTAHVMKSKGVGWELESVSMERGEATFVRQSTVMEVKTSNKALEIRLPAGTRANDGDKIAARQEEAHPGFFLVRFEPHLGKAVLAQLTDDEARCRYAVANALGVKPWEVMVRSRADGGFTLQLPRSYTGSKHDVKLAEVATSVVGQFGWFVEVNPKTLVASIIPSEPPTFDPTIPFPAERIRPVGDFGPAGDKQRFTLELAQGLGAPGEDNHPVLMSLDDSTAVLIVGLPGAGKALTDDQLLPVPPSARFPTGWARNADLVEGDLLYTPAGTLAPITSFTDWDTQPSFNVRFADGQTVTTSEGHLWKVRDLSQPEPGRRSHPERAAAARAKAAQHAGHGAIATLPDIAVLLGVGATALYRLRDRIAALAVDAVVDHPSARSWVYCMDDIVSFWRADRRKAIFCGFPLSDDDLASVAGEWFTGRAFVDHLAARGINFDRSPADLASRLSVVACKANARKKSVPGQRTVKLYPVDEVMALYAGDLDAEGEFEIVTTAQLARRLNGSDRPAVRAIAPFDSDTDDPLADWRDEVSAGRLSVSTLRAGATYRRQVLDGLIDACGLKFDSPKLADDVLELARSLGHLVSLEPDGSQITVRLAGDEAPHRGWNEIVQISAGEPRRMRCIKVDDPDHLFCVGGFIPTHNSVAVQSIVCQALVKGYRLAVIDTPAKKTDYSWAKPYVEDHWWGCDDDGTSVAEALTVATLVDEEGKRMGGLLEEYKVGKWQELPEEVKKANLPVLVVADELANLLNKPRVPGGLTKEAKALPQFVRMAQDFLEAKLLTLRLNSLVAVHRAAGVRELYLSQRPSQTEGFPPSLKSLIPHRVQLGPTPSDADLAMAFRDPRRVSKLPPNIAADPVASRGAGVAHLDGSDPVFIKGYYAPNAVFEAFLRKHLGPGDPSDARVRPTAAQIAKHVPRATEEEGIDDERPVESQPFGGDVLPSGKPVSSLDPKFGPMAPQYDENGKRLRGAAAAAKALKAAPPPDSSERPTCPSCERPIQADGSCGCSW